MSEENESIIATDNSLTSIFIGICVLFLTIVIFFKRWLTKSSTGTAAENLRSNARTLRLQVHHVQGNCVYEAISDQLRLHNPKGTYTSEIIQKHANISKKYLLPNTFYEKFAVWCCEKFAVWKGNSGWKKQVAVLHNVAEAYRRTIEVVHFDRTETTVIRPLDVDVTRPMQTLYIGHGGEDIFLSLRPENALSVNNKTEKGTRAKFAATRDGPRDNVLIGDNSQQYVMYFPSEEDDKEVCVQKNIVVGEGNSQNILATFRTSNELIEFLKEMRSSRTEGSDHSIRLKIRQKSNTLTDEQIKENELRFLKLLDDDDSADTRKELEESLEEFGVSLVKATFECILLYLSPVSNESLHTFVEHFLSGDLAKIIKLLVLKQFYNSKQVPSHIDVQLQLYMKLSVTERERLLNLEKKVESSGRKTNGMSAGISLVLRHKSISSTAIIPAHDLSEKLTKSTLGCLDRTGLLKEVDEIDVRLEKFSSLRIGAVTDKPCRHEFLQNASNTMSETVRGCVGVVLCGKGVAGTCFRIGTSYIMTAYHVVGKLLEQPNGAQRLDQNNIFIEFPDVQEKHHTELVYFNAQLDVAVLRLLGGFSNRSLKRVGECYPGFPFYTVGYPGSTKKARKTRKVKRSVVISTDYRFGWSRNRNIVLFESDMLDYGCSGAPGLAIMNGVAYIVTMLLGTLYVEDDVWYYGVNMAKVYAKLRKEDPDLAAKLFGHIYKGPINESFLGVTEVGRRVISKCQEL